MYIFIYLYIYIFKYASEGYAGEIAFLVHACASLFLVAEYQRFIHITLECVQRREVRRAMLLHR